MRNSAQHLNRSNDVLSNCAMSVNHRLVLTYVRRLVKVDTDKGLGFLLVVPDYVSQCTYFAW